MAPTRTGDATRTLRGYHQKLAIGTLHQKEQPFWRIPPLKKESEAIDAQSLLQVYYFGQAVLDYCMQIPVGPFN